MRRAQRVTRTTDPAVAAEAVARTHLHHDVGVDPAGAEFVFAERVRGTRLLSLETTACSGVVSGTVEPDSAMVLVWLKSGRGSIDGNLVPIGRPVLYRNAPQPVRFESFQQDVIRIDRATIEHVAAQRGGWQPGPVEFHPTTCPKDRRWPRGG
jgi:hypothetical protein